MLIVAIVACSAAHAIMPVDPVVVPFELRGDYAVLHVAINGHPTLLILDSGSGALVLDTIFARGAGVSWSRFIHGKAEGNTSSSIKIGQASEVRVGAATMTGVRVAGVDLQELRQKIGRDVEGTLGYELFANYVVTLDYQARTMTLENPATYSYRGTGTIIPLTFDQNLPVIAASIVTRNHGAIPARLHLDLGSATYAVRLASRFVKAHSIGEDTATITGVLGTGVGGTLQGQLLRLPQLKMGNLEINRPSTALSNAKEGVFGMNAATDGTIGSPVFRRSRLILDYSRSRAIIEPLANFSEPDPVDASGITLVRDASDSSTLRVAYVVPGSAGDAAGIRAGDVVESIDGLTSGQTKTQAVRELLRADGKTSHLVLRRGSETIPADIHLRMII
jgi:hypothetical protein